MKPKLKRNIPKYIQGKFVPTEIHKYKGNPNNIFFRSLWEYHLFQWLDKSKSVIEWGSETVVVPYVSPIDKKLHRYYIDLYAKIIDKDGVVRKYLIEVKPYKETVKPKTLNENSAKYNKSIIRFYQNLAKWQAASEFAEKNGMKFILLTERELYGKY